MRIALMHYSFFPVVGGVEKIVQSHASGLAANGYEVKVICGKGSLPTDADYEVLELPELKAESPGLNAGELKSRLLEALRGCDVVICHNMLTMPFNNVAARIIVDMGNEQLRETRFIHWTHDIAVTNPDYPDDPRVHCENSVISRCHPGIEYVCISKERLDQLATLESFVADRACVIPNGIDLWEVWGAPARLKAMLVERGILEKEVVLFHPARLLPRKRVEISIEIAAALRDRGVSVLLILSGAPDPHQSSLVEYSSKLQDLVRSLRLENEVLFAGAEAVLNDTEIAACYRMCDAVVFPSSHEGFGLPVLEAAAHGKLLMASDIATTRDHVCGESVWMSENDSAEQVAAEVVIALRRSAVWQARRTVSERFSWECVFGKHLLPLLRREVENDIFQVGQSTAKSIPRAFATSAPRHSPDPNQ